MQSVNTSSDTLPSVSEKVATPRLNSLQVDKVGFALAACESDEQLEKAVNKYLLMLLVNTATDDPETRAKVMEILVHVNKRVKSRVNVQMPVRQLLSEFGSLSASVFFKNFAIVYIKMGFSRLPYLEKIGLMSDLFTCLHNQSIAHKWTLMTLFISVYAEKHFSPNTKISPVKESKSSQTTDPDPCDVLTSELLQKFPESTGFVLQFFADVLLMPYVRSTDTATPGGFSTNSFKNLNQYLASTYSEGFLETVKIGVTRLVFNMGVSNEQKCSLLLLASSDTHSTVADVAENALRVINESVDQNNVKLVQNLCVLFCGDKRPKVPTEDKTLPVTTRTKLKILPVFLKSRLVANQPIDVVSIVYESCFGVGTTNKLRHSALLFVHHVSTFANAATMKTVGPLLKNACVKLMRGDESVTPPVDEKVINYSAMAVAKLASKKPDLMRKDFTLLSAFFKRLKDGDREQKLALQECLALLAPVYSDLREASTASEEHAKIQTILDSVIELRENTSVNQIMIKFIQNCFPLWHFASRYFLLVVTDTSDEVFSLLAEKGKPTADFDQFLLHVTSNEKVPLTSLDSDHVERVCHFLRHCLITRTDSTADITCSELKQQSKHLRKSIETHAEMGKSYAKFLLTQTERNQTSKMFFYLTEVCHVMSPAVCREVFIKSLNWARSATVCYSDALRSSAAEFYGSLKACVHEPFSENELQVLTEVNDKNAERFSGTCLSVGHYVAHKKRLEGISDVDLSRKLVPLLGKEARLFDVALSALSVLSVEVDVENVLEGGEEKKEVKDEVKEKLMKEVETVIGYTDTIHLKRKEIVVNFLGLSCLGLKSSSTEYAKRCVDILLNSSNTKQHDVQPVIGQNLLRAALGPKYPIWRSWLEEPKWSDPISDKLHPDWLGYLLDKIITDYSISAIPHVPQTCAYWLSEILGCCPPHNAIQSRARELQGALMRLLSSKNETVQDLASAALSSLFHMCGEEEKKSLIDHMMGMFTDGTTSKHHHKPKITSGDDELFSEGEVGKTPSGGSISTYKDLCSLATDLNKPDLVYKFISLSKHNMMWNSRKGAAFGFSYLAEQASSELEPHFPKLLPKLYRYKFDPNPQVRDSMGRIWSSLAGNLKDVVGKYAVEISNELISSLESREWRSREAACLALTDFSSNIYTNSSCSTSDILTQFWTLAFARCDDIKDSVRVAGEKALGSLSRAAIKCCGPDSPLGPNGKAALVGVLVPVLVEKGLGSKIKVASETSLNTLVELSGGGGIGVDERGAGAVLKPHLSMMMQALLDSLSDSEASLLNYVSLRAGEGSPAQNALDSARASSARSSRPMDCLVRLTSLVDASNIDDVTSVLCSTVQSAVGFSTKTGAAHVIVLITLNCDKELVQPHAGKLVKKMTNKLQDKSSVVRSTYSSAIPNVLKVAKSSVTNKYLVRLQSWFLDNHDLPSQLTCAKALSDMCRICPDTAQQHLQLIAPLSFVGKETKCQEAESLNGGHLAEKGVLEEVKELYGSVWNTAVTGTLTGLKLYLSEIITLCEQLFDSQSWDRKAQAAATISSISKSLFSSTDTQNSNLVKLEVLDKLLVMLLSSAIGNRFWRGKELVIGAIGDVCESSKKMILERDENRESVLSKKEMWNTVLEQWTRANDRQYDISCATCAATLTFHLRMHEDSLTQIVALTETKLQAGTIRCISVFSIHKPPLPRYVV